MPLLSTTGYDPANPSSIGTTTQDSITLLRRMRTYAEANWEDFASSYPEELTEPEKAGLLADLDTAGIVVTGAD